MMVLEAFLMVALDADPVGASGGSLRRPEGLVGSPRGVLPGKPAADNFLESQWPVILGYFC